ncbi:uncharacterized protein [Rutidosis leptorrhynchoides]|uniref:uncharacterized protein n=1 Tax=Rutidosis leptorrhynchoides TaxID=125765 RepID=UPI003A99C6A0
MSLVDYTSSSDEEEAATVAGGCKANLVISHTKPSNEKSTSLPAQQSKKDTLETSTIKLPDASLLFNSPSMQANMSESYDHNSRVSSAMAQNASRKRDAKYSVLAFNSRGKVPKGNLPRSKNVSQTPGGLLCPPQLSGRSNVVTEDINKLFTGRNGSSSNKPLTSSES